MPTSTQPLKPRVFIQRILWTSPENDRFGPRGMSVDISSIISEATRFGITATVYTSRLGLISLAKLPDHPRAPEFSLPILNDFWIATKQKVKELAVRYKSKKGLENALKTDPSLAWEIIDDLLIRFGPEVWSDERKLMPVVTKHDKTPSAKYLVYEHPEHRNEIRKQVLGWILQRAFRKAEDMRRGSNVGKPKRGRPSTPNKNFSETVLVRIPSPSSYPSDSQDELAPSPPIPKTILARRGDTARAAPASQNTTNTSAVPHAPKPDSRKAVAVMIRPRDSKGNRTTASAVRIQRKRTADKEVITGRSTQTQRRKMGRPRKAQPAPNADRATHLPSASTPISNTEKFQLKRDRQELALKLFILKDSKLGQCDLAELEQTISLIKAITQNDAFRIRAACRTKYESCEKALDRWLGCLQVVSEFRTATGYEGDGPGKRAYLDGVEPETRKPLRQAVFSKANEVAQWLRESRFTVKLFSTELALILLTMTSWWGVDMSLEDLEGDLRTFNQLLFDWFTKTK